MKMKIWVVTAMLVVAMMMMTGCTGGYAGTYSGVTDEGIPLSVTLNDDGTAYTNLFGIPVPCTYKASFGRLELTVSMFGYSDTATGSIHGDTIEFADAKLTRNR